MLEAKLLEANERIKEVEHEHANLRKQATWFTNDKIPGMLYYTKYATLTTNSIQSQKKLTRKKKTYSMRKPPSALLTSPSMVWYYR